MLNMSSKNDSDILISTSLAHRVASVLIIICLMGVLLIYLKSFFIPFVLAILLSFLLQPLYAKFKKLGLADVISVLLAGLIAFLPILLIVFTFTLTIGPLSEELPKYKDAIIHDSTRFLKSLSHYIQDPSQRKAFETEINLKLFPTMINEGIGMFQNLLKTTSSVIGYFFLTLLLAIFILLEAAAFKNKLVEAYGEEHPLLISMADIGTDVRSYVVAKTLISLFTGLLVWLFLEICGVDFALFWGLIAFPLNFIPTVGAIIASFPPMIIALIDPNLSLSMLLVVIFGLGLINGFIGSVIDPRYVGQKVSISPLVVFASMLLWGILWGAVGMILAVPIMVSIKVIFSHIRDLKQISILLRG
jgi:AI-2 transport protein TqsA